MAFTTALRADPGANGLACACAQARRFRERMRVRSTGKARVYEEMHGRETPSCLTTHAGEEVAAKRAPMIPPLNPQEETCPS